MPIAAQWSPESVAGALIALGAVLLYVASRAAVDALVRGPARVSPGRMALGHWVPIVLAACVAAAAGRSDLATGIVFASSVGALSLAAGMITYVAPTGPLPASRRAWPFILPAALLVWLAGFSAHLSAWHALLLAVLGGVVLGVWRTPREDATVGEVLADLAGPPEWPDATAAVPPRGDAVLRAAQWVLAVAVAAAGAKALVSGAVAADAVSKIFRINMLSAGVVGPMLVLPMLATGTDLAQRGRSGDACGALVGLALLNLCALLPIVILVWYVRTAWPGVGGPLALAGRLVQQGQPLPLPLTIWRIDAIVLVIAGLALLPVALGRWVIGRLEATGLILVYAGYLAATAAVAFRR